MKLAHILCPIDFSSNHALNVASQLAKATGATLHLLYVEENAAPYGIGLYGQLPAPLKHDVTKINEVEPTVGGVNFERHVALGTASDKILSFAKDNDVDVDVIVMGTHGRTGAMRLLMGSVAEKVVRHAKCAVLTITQPQPSAATPSELANSNQA